MRYTSAVGDVEVGDGRGSDGQVVRVRRTSWGLFFAITASSLTMHAATGQTASAQADVDVQVVPNIEGGSSQDDEARSLFLAGQTAFEAGRYEAALGHFRAALEVCTRHAAPSVLAPAAVGRPGCTVRRCRLQSLKRETRWTLSAGTAASGLAASQAAGMRAGRSWARRMPRAS